LRRLRAHGGACTSILVPAEPEPVWAKSVPANTEIVLYARPMTPQQAILIGAGIIGASIIAARAMALYEISATRGADGNPMVWPANALTGNLEFCTFQTASKPTWDELMASGAQTAAPKLALRCSQTLP
jgi:hypothetical protein